MLLNISLRAFSITLKEIMLGSSASESNLKIQKVPYKLPIL
jgi:hypothetical protein